MTCEANILLVDDHAMLRKGLRVLIEREEDLCVIGEAGNGYEAIEQVRQLQPDIVVMDINMPELSGIEATKKILDGAPNTQVLALSIHSGQRYVEEMLEAGAAGYLVKQSAPDELIRAIRALKAGNSYLSAEITDIVIKKVRQQPTEGGASGIASHTMANKLCKPPLPKGLVHRQELVERLEQGQGKKLQMVVAPAGYGKSTLVCDWLKDSVHPNIWLSLDRTDNSLRQFLKSWMAALGEFLPGANKYLSPFIESANLPPTSILGGAMLADLENLPHAFVLVLDNMHLVREKSILDLLSQVVSRSDGTLRLVLISKQDLFLPLTALRADNMVNDIRTEDLRFSSGEIKSFLENALATTIDAETVTIWEERTQGWVTGLQLATHTLRDSDAVVAVATTSESTVDWREFLTNREFEVLRLLRQRLRDKEIADQLCISTDTVKTHLRNLYRKLEATNRREAIVNAQNLKFL